MFSLRVFGAQVWDSSVLEVRFGILFNPLLRSALLNPWAPPFLCPQLIQTLKPVRTAVLFPPSLAPLGVPVRVGTMEGGAVGSGVHVGGGEILAKGALSSNRAPVLLFFSFFS